MSRESKRAVQVFGRHTVNKLAQGLLKNGVYIPPFTPDRVLLVEHTGRKSGVRRTTPMGFVPKEDGVFWVVAEHGRKSDWVRNALKSGVRVWRGTNSFEAIVQLLEDEDPGPVWARMKSKMLVAMAKALSHEPKVLEIRRKESAGKG